MTLFDNVTMYDAVMALIVIFTTVHGYWKGATWQIAPIMSLVLGYMIAMPMSVTSAHYFGDPPQNRLYALVTIYIGVSLVVYLMVRSFRAGIEKAKLTEFDKHIGAMLGALKGLLLTLAITVILLIYSPVARDLILKSESSTIAAKIINAVYPILPQAMHQILAPYLHQLNNELPLDIGTSDDGNLNSKILPDRGTNSPSNQSPLLSPTNSGARRLPDDEDDIAYPPAPPPRRRSMQYNDNDPQTDRRFDSAARTNRRVPASDRDLSNPPRQQVLTPTINDEDDPFRAGNPNR